MNKISDAGINIIDGKHTAKRLECLAATGKCSFVSEEKIDFDSGQALVIPPKTEYSFSGEAIYIAFDRYALPFKKVTLISDDKWGGLKFAAEQAADYFPRGGLVPSALGELISAYLVEFAPNRALSPVIVTVRDEILKNISNSSFALDEYLNSLPLNGEYVRKLFKRETGTTPHRLLIDERMKLAEYILSGGASNQYSDYSVAQTAEACGFSEPLYFSRLFKKHFGVSPSEYLKK